MGFYELLGARDAYRDATAHEGGMHIDLVLEFIRVQALLLTPIAPHISEHLWATVLGESTSVQVARFPKISAPIDTAVLDSGIYVRTTLKTIRDAELKFQKQKAKGKAILNYDPSKPKGIKVYISKGFPEWQEKAVGIVRDATSNGVVDDVAVRSKLAELGLAKDKRYMPFIAQFKVCLHFSNPQ